MSINSRQGLKDFCLRQLGFPVIDINVADEQVEDCVDLALEYFFEFHADGLERTYFSKALTTQDLTNEYITLPEDIVSVVKLFPLGTAYDKSVQYQAFISDIIDMARKGNTSSYLVNMQYYNTISQIFNNEKPFRFNKSIHKIYIDFDWSRLTEGDVVLMECYKIIDPEEYTSIWNDKWLRSYATQRIKLQWSANMKKYAGVTLPGGLTLDAVTWYNEASAEILRLEEELRSTYELPVMGFTG